MAVIGGPVFSSIAVGVTHGCGIKDDGSTWCWGNGTNGRLGNQQNVLTNGTPVQVLGGHLFAEVAAGGEHTCALTANGNAWCWSVGTSGQLGNGTNTNNLPVVQVSGGHSFSSISSGYYHTCGLRSDGRAMCWGQGGSGQLGKGNTADANVPGLVLNGS